jgi:hypothetical protein
MDPGGLAGELAAIGPNAAGALNLMAIDGEAARVIGPQVSASIDRSLWRLMPATVVVPRGSAAVASCQQWVARGLRSVAARCATTHGANHRQEHRPLRRHWTPLQGLGRPPSERRAFPARKTQELAGTLGRREATTITRTTLTRSLVSWASRAGRAPGAA